MLRSYLIIAIRNLKNKIFSLINIFGLAAGIACFLLIAGYVYNELTYDRYAIDTKDIYRVKLSVTGNGKVAVYPEVDIEVGSGIKDAFPEVKSFARIVPVSDNIKYGEKQFKEDHISYADSNFPQIFSD